MKKNIVVIKVELKPIPFINRPMEATIKFPLAEITIFPTQHSINSPNKALLLPKLSLKYPNPSNPISTPNGADNFENMI